MKFPSLSHLQDEAFDSAKRFPLSILSAIVGTMLAIYLTEVERFEENIHLLNLVLTFALGIPLFLCIDLFAEKHHLSPVKRQLGWLAALAVLGLIYISFPAENEPSNTRVPYIRYIVYFLALHLMVAFLPFLGKSETAASFWNFNKNLFIRLVIALFFTNVISTGISFALAAVNELFKADIQPQTFAQMYILSLGVFNTWYFLAGIPENFEEEIKTDGYPKGLKIFTQFILIPLLLIYLTILYFYGGKIILLWDWPEGIVSYMIIAISVLGIFTNLLLFPIQDKKETSWIKTFYKAFYFLLIPLVVLLFLAIGIRIGDYGLTVNRYVITLMGIWLSFISIYFILGFKNIKTIPISLSIAMILSSFGPWGMFSMSERNQLDRLESLLTKAEILQENKIQNEIRWRVDEKGKIIPAGQKPTKTIPLEDLDEINSIIQYLDSYHGMGSVLPWFEQDLEAILDEAEEKSARFEGPVYSKLIVESLGLEYVQAGMIGVKNPESRFYSFQAKENSTIALEDFEVMVRFHFNAEPEPIPLTLPGSNSQLEIKRTDDLILILKKDTQLHQIQLEPLVNQLIETNGDNSGELIDPESMKLDTSINNLKIRIYFTQINYDQGQEQVGWSALQGYILLKEL
ncbi:MAG: DUF4153 domain-containing protein [Algoriphagus sp.]|nr:DUF4153 domain-containing protein [Algoriphagus sp.]